jgi:hypothetical protein
MSRTSPQPRNSLGLRIDRLSPGQKEALSVLVMAGGRVEAGKRRSTREPRAYVNQRAASSLVQLGLACCIDPDLERGYTHKYEATEAGRKLDRTDTDPSQGLPRQQSRAMDHLLSLPFDRWATRSEIAAALASTKRGAGVVISALFDRGLLTCTSRDNRPLDDDDGDWAYRAKRPRCDIVRREGARSWRCEREAGHLGGHSHHGGGRQW